MQPALQILPDQLRERLSAHFERSRALFDALQEGGPHALILGGGYGRGEGGIVETADGEFEFFNDLDYFLFLDSPDSSTIREQIASWESEESAKLGIDVECKPLKVDSIGDPSKSMMFYDLVAGHTVVWGDDSILDDKKGLLEEGKITLLEATRLLWNRGSGLFFAADQIRKGTYGLAHRNQCKLMLALGDAILVEKGGYHCSVKTRHERLAQDHHVDPEVVSLHKTATSFKFTPTPPPPLSTLEQQQKRLCRLWTEAFLRIESARLRQEFSTPEDYVSYKGRLYPDHRLHRNLLLAFRDRLKRDGFLRPIWDYPRGALQRELVWQLQRVSEGIAPAAPRFLSAIDDAEATKNYEYWWQYYS